MEDAVLPLYTETDGISPGLLRKIISMAIDKVIDNPQQPNKDLPEKFKHPFGVPDPLPQWLKDKYKLIDKASA